MTTKGRTGAAPSGKDLPQTWLLCGDDPRFFEEAAARWVATWGGEEGAVSIPAPGLPPASFHTEVNSLPFLKERQVVRLTHLEGGSKELLEAVAAYCRNPCPTTALLMECIGEAPSAKKTSRVPSPLAAIFEAVPCQACQPRSIRSYAEGRLRAEGFTGGPGFFEALEEWAGKDASKAASALDLLLLYRAGEKVLREEDAGALLGAGGSPQRWKLLDAWVERSGRKFLTLLGGVEADPEVQRDPAGTAIAFGAMTAKQVRGLLLARSLTDSGRSRAEVVQALQAVPLRLSSFAASKILEALPGWPEQEIRGAIAALYRLDLALKGGAEPAPPWTHVERSLRPFLRGRDARAPRGR